MDSLQSTQSVVAPDRRPAVTGPSTAVRDPDPKPVPEDHKPPPHRDRFAQHDRMERRGRKHVQQGLRHVIRDIRHAIRDEVKAGVKSGATGRLRDVAPRGGTARPSFAPERGGLRATPG